MNNSVKKLIEELQKLPADSEVYSCYLDVDKVIIHTGDQIIMEEDRERTIFISNSDYPEEFTQTNMFMMIDK